MPTLEATFGGPEANVYITVADAENQVLDLTLSTSVARVAWENADDSDKAVALLTGARHIDARRWKGEKWFQDQRLSFPRSIPGYYRLAGYAGVYDGAVFEELLNTDEYLRRMKERVRFACVLQALAVLKLEGEDAHREEQFAGVAGWSRGHGLSESASYQRHSQILCPEAMDQLRLYRSHGPDVVRGGSRSGLPEEATGRW